MESEFDITALSHSELVALVYNLRSQLAARDREIARLKQPAAEKPAQDAENISSPTGEGIQLGTQSDLIAQLEKMYPED